MIPGLPSRAAVGMPVQLLLLVTLAAPSLLFIVLPPVLPEMAAFFGGGAHGRAVAQGAQALPFLTLALGGVVAGPILRLIGDRDVGRGAGAGRRCRRARHA